eukprot:6460551-Amphidinium_carterae.5
MKRASKHHSTPMLTADSYPKGSQVGIWMNPTSKDASGWRGPATVHLTDPEHDTITVKWQSKTLDLRSAETRPHDVTYLLTETLPGAEQSWHRIVTIIKQQQSPSSLAVGYHLHDSQWQKTAQSMKPPGKQLLQQAEILASHIGLSSPFMLRWSRGLSTLPYMQEFGECEVWLMQQGDSHVEHQIWLDGETAQQLYQAMIAHPGLVHRVGRSSRSTRAGVGQLSLPRMVAWNSQRQFQQGHPTSAPADSSTATSTTSPSPKGSDKPPNSTATTGSNAAAHDYRAASTAGSTRIHEEKRALQCQ